METLKKDYFQVCVKVLEGSHLPGKNISSFVCVQVGEEKRYTKVIHHTNNPFYDDIFVFFMIKSFFDFMNTLLTISIFEKRKHIKVKKLIGCITMDIATIWNCPDRRLRKWLSLTVPSDPTSQKKAFVECELKVEAAKIYPQLPIIPTTASVDIMGDRKARYKILIYHCIGLEVQNIKKSATDILVKVVFAGKTGNTTIRTMKEFVEWNEQLVFVELFPPLYQRLTLEVYTGKSVLAMKCFYLFDFFKTFQGGFLNIFGPAYVHLYTNEYLYRGSLFMAIQSEIVGILREFERFYEVTVETFEPISQIKYRYGNFKKFICFAVLYDLIITKENCAKEDLYLSLGFLNTESVETKKYTAVPTTSFLYVPFNERKPCVSVLCEWPDCSHRHFNSNLIANLADDLREKLNLANGLISRGRLEEGKLRLNSAINSVKKGCKRILQSLSDGFTELDARRKTFLSTQLSEFLTFSENDNLDITLQNCKLILNILDSNCEDNQDSLPLLLISLKQNGTPIGYCSLQSRHLLFSESKHKRGRNSAKINSLFLNTEDGKPVGRIDVWFWLGTRDRVSYCKKELPPGHKRLKETLFLPSSLTYTTNHTYSAMCHIFSGYIDDGEVNEGQCDSYVKVCFLNQSRQTITAKRSLAPTWKETLVLSNIKLYPSPDYIKDNPPYLTVELWNKSTKPATLIGTTLVASTVTLQPISNIPEFSLKWRKLGKRSEVLAAFQIIQIPHESDSGEVFSTLGKTSFIPRPLEQATISYRLEIVFWGMRPSSVYGFKNIVQPQVIIQCSTAELSSNVISRANATFNFQRDTRIVIIQLPEERMYSPPLIVRITANGKHLNSIAEKNIYRYETPLFTKSEWETLYNDRTTGMETPHRVTMPDVIPQVDFVSSSYSALTRLREIPGAIKCLIHNSIFDKILSLEESSSEDDSDDEMDQDWWDRYWKGEIKTYTNKLESQKEYSGFHDVLSIFPVKKKKEVALSEIGKVKTIIKLYRWPNEEPVVTRLGEDPEAGILKPSEINQRIKLLVRVYCVKALNLYPSDAGGKADPYIEIATPTKSISDKSNKVLRKLNPVFGSCLEITATLPTDSVLAVRVMDWDLYSRNDLIGETIIDIENRFYSKHRATCGLPTTFSRLGNNSWRDVETPTEILERLCIKHNIPLPQYYEKSVIIGSKEFAILKPALNKEENRQRLALAALNRWNEMPIVGRNLVSEHIETRSLFREDKPGLVQGKLEMWVDLFDMSLGNVPAPMNIAPRKPHEYELRVNILNTANVPLVDALRISGKKCTDILVSGWLGEPDNVQKTDVHYNSYTGTGNFNWRFVFPFLYLRQEKKIVFYKKNLFDIGKTENKVPAIIQLELYDSGGFLENMFIGGIMLELCRMPRGASSVAQCNVDKVLDPSNTVDLFKVETLSGWWPFLPDKTVRKERGFLEAEFHLVTAQEAKTHPVGLGRAGPDPLPNPARVTRTYNPYRQLRNIITQLSCPTYRTYVLDTVIIFVVIALICILIYTVPSLLDKLKPWDNTISFSSLT